MEYKKIKTQIENAVRKSPSDPVPYEDMFSLCRDMEKEDFAKAHKWNQAFRKKISAAIRLSVTDGDMLAAEQFDNLLFRSLLFGAPHFFDDYLQAVEFGKPLDKKFYQPRRHYLKRYVDAYQEVLEGKLDFLSISMPKRAGKSQLGINFTNMLSGKFPDRSKVFYEIGGFAVAGFNNAIAQVGKTTRSVVGEWANSFTNITPTMAMAVDTSALRYYDSDAFARTISSNVETNSEISSTGFKQAMEDFYREYVEPTLNQIAEDTRRQADKDEHPIVQIGNRVITDAVDVQTKANGYRFTK